MISFLDFVNSSQNNITEAFKDSDMDLVCDKITVILKRHVLGLMPLSGFYKTVHDSDKTYSKIFLVVDTKTERRGSIKVLFTLNWLREGNSNIIHSIDFFSNPQKLIQKGYDKTLLTLNTLGTSIVFFLPIIWSVINSGNYSISQDEAIKLGRSAFAETDEIKKQKMFGEGFIHYVGGMKYKCFENFTQKQCTEAYKLNVQEEMTPARALRNDIKNKSIDAMMYKDVSKEKKEDAERLMDAYKELGRIIRGGAESLDDVKMALTKNIWLREEIDKKLEEQEELLAAKHKDPEIVFKKMEKYVKLVIKGINPSVIICGAPGVGKTYRVRQLLSVSGYREGYNLCTVKGKMSPRVLYLTLMDYKKKGDILLIDDADSLIGPNAKEDSINILKAALDSTSFEEGRKIVYGIAGPLKDDEGNPVEKSFYYNGSVIVLTNWNAGNLDSALRGRSYIHDIHFSLKDTLKIIKDIMPALDPEHLSAESKKKAYDYILKISEDKDNNYEISLRTFVICAKFYESAKDDNDFGDDLVEEMINEQLSLMGQRGGKKY